jgi:hypothetical protein
LSVAALFFIVLVMLMFTLPLGDSPAIVNEIIESESANIETGVDPP